MVMMLFLLLTLSSYTFAGEPVCRVAQQRGSAFSNVREALSRSFTPRQQKSDRNKRYWIALGVTAAAFAASAPLAADAIMMYENTEDTSDTLLADSSPTTAVCYKLPDYGVIFCFFKGQLTELSK